jgi:hypothetical protein
VLESRVGAWIFIANAWIAFRCFLKLKMQERSLKQDVGLFSDDNKNRSSSKHIKEYNILLKSM